MKKVIFGSAFLILVLVVAQSINRHGVYHWDLGNKNQKSDGWSTAPIREYNGYKRSV